MKPSREVARSAGVVAFAQEHRDAVKRQQPRSHHTQCPSSVPNSVPPTGKPRVQSALKNGSHGGKLNHRPGMGTAPAHRHRFTVQRLSRRCDDRRCDRRCTRRRCDLLQKATMGTRRRQRWALADGNSTQEQDSDGPATARSMAAAGPIRGQAHGRTRTVAKALAVGPATAPCSRPGRARAGCRPASCGCFRPRVNNRRV